MSDSPIKFTTEGVDKVLHAMKDMQDKLGPGTTIKVGFLEGTTYRETGISVPMVAAIQEYGATINMPARTTTVYRKTNAAGTDFLHGGRFVKRSESNFASTHDVPAHTVTIPPRPFMRNTVTDHQDEWPKNAADLLRANNLDVGIVAPLMGELIKGQIQQTIKDFHDPPNAPSTIRKKGFDNPLIDSSEMLNFVDYNVDTIS